MTPNSCYWSLNTSLQKYKIFLGRLEKSVRGRNTEIIKAGDFNSWHTSWGSEYSNARGDALIDLVTTLSHHFQQGQNTDFPARKFQINYRFNNGIAWALLANFICLIRQWTLRTILLTSTLKSLRLEDRWRTAQITRGDHYTGWHQPLMTPGKRQTTPEGSIRRK